MMHSSFVCNLSRKQKEIQNANIQNYLHQGLGTELLLVSCITLSKKYEKQQFQISHFSQNLCVTLSCLVLVLVSNISYLCKLLEKQQLKIVASLFYPNLPRIFPNARSIPLHYIPNLTKPYSFCLYFVCALKIRIISVVDIQQLMHRKNPSTLEIIQQFHILSEKRLID